MELSNDLLEPLPQKVLSKIPGGEKIVISIRGGYPEWLICTDKQLYVIKKGYFTGNTFGIGMVQMPYCNISGVTVTYHLLSGYFEVFSGGVQMKRRTKYTQMDVKPQKSPNCILISSKKIAEKFRAACRYINERINSASSPMCGDENPTTAEHGLDVLDKLADLHNRNIITDEEFQKKKADILSKI